MKKHERLPFEVIVSATEGDPEAIATVMNFYDGYISKQIGRASCRERV